MQIKPVHPRDTEPTGRVATTGTAAASRRTLAISGRSRRTLAISGRSRRTLAISGR